MWILLAMSVSCLYLATQLRQLPFCSVLPWVPRPCISWACQHNSATFWRVFIPTFQNINKNTGRGCVSVKSYTENIFKKWKNIALVLYQLKRHFFHCTFCTNVFNIFKELCDFSVLLSIYSKVLINLEEGLGISLVNKAPEELVFTTLSGIDVHFTRTASNEVLELSIQKIQVRSTKLLRTFIFTVAVNIWGSVLTVQL